MPKGGYARRMSPVSVAASYPNPRALSLGMIFTIPNLQLICIEAVWFGLLSGVFAPVLVSESVNAQTQQRFLTYCSHISGGGCAIKRLGCSLVYTVLFRRGTCDIGHRRTFPQLGHLLAY